VGGIGEIFDGDATGYGESVGAVLQLWSMAELIRTLTYTLTGFETDLQSSTIKFYPHALKLSNYFVKNIPFIENNILLQLENNDTQLSISLDDVPEGYIVEIVVPKKFSAQLVDVQPKSANITHTVYSDTEELIKLSDSTNYLIRITNGSSQEYSSKSQNDSAGLNLRSTLGSSFFILGILRKYSIRKKRDKLA
ncbi:MAG: hypothetical protein ACW99A_15080, partial [Candidatus Kariarchaeaceae archaeon]